MQSLKGFLCHYVVFSVNTIVGIDKKCFHFSLGNHNDLQAVFFLRRKGKHSRVQSNAKECFSCKSFYIPSERRKKYFNQNVFATVPCIDRSILIQNVFSDYGPKL